MATVRSKEPPASAQTVRRILVVDDDVDFADSLVDILGLCSYDVAVAHNARDALRVVQEFDAQVALLDIRLGKSNGLDLIEELRGIHPGILCVVMTAYSGATSAVEAVEAGAYDYLTKPLGAGDLLATLERCFQNVRLLDEKEKMEAALRIRDRELDRMNARLDAVLSSAEKLVAELDIEQPGVQILKEFASALDAQGGSLYLRREKCYECVATLDPGHAAHTLPLTPDPDTVFGQAVAGREAVLLIDVTDQKGMRPSGWEGYHDGSLVAFPLISKGGEGEVVGLLALHNRTNPPFSTQDLRLGKVLLALAGQALRLVDATLARREVDERFRTVVHTSAYGMALITGDGRVDLFSPAAEAITGRSEKEVLGHSFLDLLTRQSRMRCGAPLMAYLHDGDPSGLHGAAMELSLVRPDGEALPVAMHFSVGSEGDSRFALGIFRETSAERELEIRLSRAQKMQLLGQLSGGVAHDFNNLLQAMIAHTQLALMDLDGGGERAPNDLREVLKTAERASGLTRQLLTFSRRETMEPIRVDINLLIGDLTKMLRRLIEADVELQIELSGESCLIHADLGQVEQVLMNLVVNARDSLESGGTIRIKTEPVDIDDAFARENDWAQPGEWVRLDVGDTGCGMDADMLPHIFEPFFTTKESGHGTGLGLAIVYDIVRRHEGLVHVDTARGKGTTFSIYFPRAERASEENGRVHRMAPAGGSETVLLAEDDDIVRDLTTRLLKKAGYHILEARNGLEAIELFDAHRDEVDMALLDAVMPQRNGREVYEHIRSVDAGFPILFCSGYSGSTLQTEFIAAEGLSLIPKPYNRDTLLRAVRQTLDRAR